VSSEPTTRDLGKRSDHLSSEHGRWARHPWQMPWPAWKDSLWRTALSLQGDRVALVAAGVTFYLLGAELDSEIEHQTSIDTTVGPDRPQGNRGAHVADTIGRAKRDSDSWFQPPDADPPPNPE